MDARSRSPSYPSTPIGEAIDLAERFYAVERTHAVDRDVAAKAMGYSGLSGRSATILSNLIQYGLLEKTGKNEVRLTRRTIDILFPDSERSAQEAMLAAAKEPELFQRIRERFPDGIPSEASLEAFLVRQGFTPVAIPPATRAYRETFLFLEDAIESESHQQARPDVVEPQPNQQVERTATMSRQQLPATYSVPAVPPPGSVSGPTVHLDGLRQIWLGGVVTTQADADYLIAAVTALKGMLRVEEPKPQAASAAPAAEDDNNPFS